jgi:hypothetical protein
MAEVKRSKKVFDAHDAPSLEEAGAMINGLKRETVSLRIKAVYVENLGNGEFHIEVEGASITEEQRRVIRELFPTLGEQVYHLLSQQALLNAVL